MGAPRTYSEWSSCIDALAAGHDDEQTANAIAAGTLEWTSGVAELFAERMSTAFGARLARVAQRLSRELSLGSDETTVVRAVMDARRSLGLLQRVASAGSLPQVLREHLLNEVAKYARGAQQSLEASAKSDRSGRLLMLLRNNSLERFAPATR